MPSEPAPGPGSACSGRAGAAGARGHAHHRPAGRREGGKEGGRRQPRARSREGGGGSAGAGPGTPVPLPRRTRRGRGEARVSRPAGKLSGGGGNPGGNCLLSALKSQKVVALLPAAKGCGREEVSCFGTTCHLQFFSDSLSPAQLMSGKEFRSASSSGAAREHPYNR